MAPRFASLFVLFRNVRGLMVSTAFVVLSATAVPALAKTSYENPATAEGWAWMRIKRGEEADFNARCKTPTLFARPNDERIEKGWQDNCRRLPTSFLVDVLTKTPWRDQIPFAGVHIVGARIVGDIDLKNAHVNRELSVKISRIDGKVELDNARTDSNVDFGGSRLKGVFSAHEFRVEGSLSLWGTVFEQSVALANAKVDGNVWMDGALFYGELYASHMHVGGTLYMEDVASFKGANLWGTKVAGHVDLRGATFDGELSVDFLQVDGNLAMIKGASFKHVSLGNAKIAGDLQMAGASFASVFLRGATVGGQITMNGAKFAGDLNADGVHVGAELAMGQGASFKGVNLIGGNIGGNVQMGGAKFDGDLTAGSLRVGASLFITDGTSFKGVMLDHADIAGQLEMVGSSFEGPLIAESLRVGGDLLMWSSVYAREVDALFANIGGNFDLRGATLAWLDLSGASIGRDLALGGLDESHPSTVWRTKDGTLGSLILRNTRVGNLVDAEDAWPEMGHLYLDGFTLNRFGGFGQAEQSSAYTRGAKWWDKWARLDPSNSSHPYQQLVAVFAAAGDHNLADEIRYAGRVREHEMLTGWSWLWSWPLRWVAGFGIYPHRVLYWIGGVSFAGAVYLWKYSKGVCDAGHTFGWCWGASLARLLPVIEINKEFTEFFNDPERKRLTGFQMGVFSFIGVLGWFLAAILVAAVSGVTGKS